MRPTISIVIPVFNRERLLAQAIDSLQPQLEDGDEVIVVDDGSTDGSIAVAAGYPRVIVEALGINRGAATALNHGIRRASNEWLAFLDSDDLAAPDRFVQQGRALLGRAAPDVVMGSQWRFSGEGWPVPPDPIPPAQIDHGSTAPTMLLRRATFLTVGLFDESLPGTYFAPWYAQAVELGLKITHDSTVVLWRRAHSGGHLSQTVAQARDYARALKQILDRRRTAQAATHGRSPAA